MPEQIKPPTPDEIAARARTAAFEGVDLPVASPEPPPAASAVETAPAGLDNSGGSRPEDIAQAELNQVINDFQTKKSQIAEMRAKKTGRFASLAKSLGIETRDLSSDPEVMSLEKESQDIYRNLVAKGIHLYKGTPQLEDFLKKFDEFEVFRTTYNQEMDERTKACKWPESVLAGFQKLGQKWSEMSWKKKLLIGGAASGLMTVGAIGLGAGTFGAAALSMGWRWGFRAFGSMAVGIGRKMQLDVNLMREMEQGQENVFQEKMNILNKWGDNLDEGIEEILSKSPTLSAKVEKGYKQRSLENTIRARNLALKSFAISSVLGESFRLASQASGINLGTILKKIGGDAGFGGGSVATQASEQLQPSAGNLPNPESAKFSSETFEQVQKAVEDLNPDKHLDDLAKDLSKNYAGSVEPETKTGGSLQEWAKNTPAAGAEVHLPDDLQKPAAVSEQELKMSDMRAPDAEQKISELANKELGYNKIGQGGGIEKSAKAIIKANPREFGLDPNDPQLNTKAGKEAHKLARGLAEKYGMTYKELNKIASHNVQPGDEVRIFKDPATGKLNLTYNGAAFDNALSPDNVRGANVTPQGGSPVAPAEEAVSARPKLVPAEETNRPKLMTAEEYNRSRAGGTAADHRPSRGAGKVPPEIEEWEKRAKARYAEAVDYEKRLGEFHKEQSVDIENQSRAAHLQQYQATSSLIRRVFEGAGVSEYADVLKRPMSEWDSIVKPENYIAHDVMQAGESSKLNLNLENLRKLRPILEKYNTSGFDSIGECLFKAMKDSKNVYLINRLVLNK